MSLTFRCFSFQVRPILTPAHILLFLSNCLPERKWRGAFVVLLAWLCCSLPALALTPAHTVIKNQSTATYRWFGRDYGIASNAVSNIVAPRYGILLTPDGTVPAPGLTAQAEPGQTVYLPYTLTNTGNVSDSYELSLSNLLQGSFFPSEKKIYHDINGNGRVDAGEPELTQIEALPAGGQAQLLVSLTVPAKASYGQHAYHDVIGKSLGDPTQIDKDNVNFVELVRDAVLKITKTPAVAQVAPGGEIDFTLSVINLGSLQAKPELLRVNGVERKGILVADALPGIDNGEISYVAGSLNAAPAKHRRIFRLAGSDEWRELNAAEEESRAAEIIEIGVLFEDEIGLLVPGQQAQVRFRLAVANNHPAKQIENISRVHYRSQSGTPLQDLSTNTVQVMVMARSSDILIGPYNDPDAVGDIFGTKDNNGDATYDPGVPVTDPNPYGTQVVGNMVYFLNTVRNDSNAVDTINLTIDSTNLPEDWLPLVRLMAVSGIEPRYLGDSSKPFLHPETGKELFAPSNVSTLFDTNGDGIPDTGPLAPGATYTFAVRLLIPEDALSKGGSPGTRSGGSAKGEGYGDNNGEGYRVTVRARSTLDPSKTNLTSNVIKRIMQLGNFWDPFVKEQDVPNTVTIGTTINYVNIFGNNGPGPVYNTIITDELDSHLTNIHNITQGELADSKGGAGKITVTGSYDSLAHTVSWHIFEIPAGFEGKIGFSADIAANTADGTEIVNTFAITSDQTDTVRHSNEVVHAVGGENVLTISKKASTDKIEIGDPVRYELEVNNAGDQLLRNVMVDDLLPRGFRYLKGSCRVDGEKVEPEIAENGVSLSWNLGNMAAKAKVIITYACIATSDVKLGHNTNNASASGILPKGTTISASASADVEVEQGIFHNDSIIIGKVFIDQNDDRVQNHAEPGIQGVRLILEDGTYVITDREGKYHFSGIKPGMHVLRLDETTLPPGMTPSLIDSQNALNPLSRTIELRYGTPHKANFRVLPKAEPEKPAAESEKEAEKTEAPAEDDKGAMLTVPDNVLLPVQISRQGAASVLLITCESPLKVTWEHDQQSGIVHLMLPGVVSSQQALRQTLDDPNLSSLSCHLDEEQKRGKLQVRMRRRSSGYPSVQVEVSDNGARLFVGQETAPDHDPEPGAQARKKQRLAAMPELVPLILT
ncbi:MAG: DUF7507 domain-containing protein, partial [Candidatus Hydrogenedentales bacterium]